MKHRARALRPSGRALLKLAAFVLLVVLANYVSGHVVEALEMELRPSNEPFVHRMTMLAAAAYMVLIAIPFVPGVEVGLALIGMLGPRIVFLVYVCTVLGLCIAFTVGRLASLRWLVTLLTSVGLTRAGGLVRHIEPMAQDERLAFLISRAPTRVIPFLLRHRYIALALVVNLPGNIVIGGGGGISLMAGASRLFSVAGFLVTILLAVAPVPVAILIFGERLLAD